MIMEIDQEEEVTKLLKHYQEILKELRIHAREQNCQCLLSQLLDKVEFDEQFDQKK